jgi:hypothetical protein
MKNRGRPVVVGATANVGDAAETATTTSTREVTAAAGAGVSIQRTAGFGACFVGLLFLLLVVLLSNIYLVRQVHELRETTARMADSFDAFLAAQRRQHTGSLDLQTSIHAATTEIVGEVLRLHRRQEQIQVDIMAGKLHHQQFENESMTVLRDVVDKVRQVGYMVAQSSNVIVDNLGTLRSHLMRTNTTLRMLDSTLEWGHASALSPQLCRVDDAAGDVHALIRWRLLDSPAVLQVRDVANCLRHFEQDDDTNVPYRGLMKVYLYDESAALSSSSSSPVEWFHVAEVDMQLPIVFSTDLGGNASGGPPSSGQQQPIAILRTGLQVSSALLKSHWFSRTLRLQNLPVGLIGVKVGLSFRQYSRSCNFTWAPLDTEKVLVEVGTTSEYHTMWHCTYTCTVRTGTCTMVRMHVYVLLRRGERLVGTRLPNVATVASLLTALPPTHAFCLSASESPTNATVRNQLAHTTPTSCLALVPRRRCKSTCQAATSRNGGPLTFSQTCKSCEPE